MAEIKCPCGLRDDMEYEECQKINCDSCCPLAKPETNADRIRAMSDEELAYWICSICGECGDCVAFDLCSAGGGTSNGLKKWLKQPAEVEE